MSSTSVRVLHVDDEPDFADLAASYLEREDERFDVDTATSAAEGLDRLAGADYDCVISDYDMPRTDGIGLLKQVREEYPDLPFVLFTGKGSEEVASEAISAGVTDYLQKERGTSQYAVLANRITNAVEQFRTKRRARRQRRQHRELFDRAPVMYVVTRDVEGQLRVEDCNDRFVEKLGYDRETIVGSPISEFYTEESRRKMHAEGGYERALCGEFESEERTLRARDGGTIETINRASPLLNERGDPVNIQALYLDVTERKERERELERYETMIETIPDGVYALDEDFHYIAVNQGMADLLGYSKEELIGEHISLVNDKTAIGRSRRNREELTADGIDDEIVVSENTHVTADGEAIPCEVRFRALPPDDDGSFRGTAGVIRDIPDRKEREQELEEYREYTDRLLDAIDDLFYVHDENGEIRRWNESLVDVTGYSEEELASMDAAEVIAGDHRERTAERIRTVFETGHARLEAPLLTKDGTTIPYEFVADRVEHPDDEPRLVGIGRDISERVEAEAQLREERNRLSALFENAPQPIVEAEITATDSRPIVGVNDEFTDVFGYDAAEIVGREIADVLVPADEQPAHEQFRERGATGNSFSAEVRRTTADGERTFLLDLIPYGTESMPADGAFAIYTDITDRKARKQELERKNERLEEFASVVSHDLRNPLNVAEGNVELARGACDSEHLDTVARALDRMDALIEDLLTLAHEGTSAEDVETVDLTDVVDACWENVDTADATLSVHTEQTIRADRSRLAQLLENLIHNAVEYGGSGVTVTVGALDDSTGFYVEDDGPGVPADEREDVFAYGYSTDEDGTGFGLAIVKEIAEAHEWDVTLTESDDGGARFEITSVDTTP